MFLWWVSGSLGIGMGYHRLLIIAAQARSGPEYCLTICDILTLKGGPIFWVGTYRIHHDYLTMKAIRIHDRWQLVGGHGLDPNGQVDPP